VLEPLIANQRAVHGGQPGGLGQAMTAAEREAARGVSCVSDGGPRA
jgi:hypothetical protein